MATAKKAAPKPAAKKKPAPTADHHRNFGDLLKSILGIVGALAVITPIAAAPFVDEEDAAKIKAATAAASAIAGVLPK